MTVTEALTKILIATYTAFLPLIAKLFADAIKRNDKIDNISSKVDKLTRVVEDNYVATSRYRIIRFDDEMSQGIEHSDDHWIQILDDIDIYKRYCDEHPNFQNHRGQGAMSRILKTDENRRMKGK